MIIITIIAILDTIIIVILVTIIKIMIINKIKYNEEKNYLYNHSQIRIV